MGTRNLTIVVKDKQTKIAQYGQWDGYPSASGIDILHFLKWFNFDKFAKQVDKVKFIGDKEQKEIDNFFSSIGVKGDWMDGEQAKKYKAKYPLLSRDVGADILELVLNSNNEPIFLNNSEDFIKDSLFCEWAYVLDLDKKVLEVYNGFNQKPVPKGQRFTNTPIYTPEHRTDTYYPCVCLKKYPFAKLPTDKIFLQELEIDDEEE